MRKWIALLISVVMLVTLLAGCGANSTSTPDTSKKLSGKITFYSNMTHLVDTTLKDMAKEFTDQNPGTEIENISVAGDEFGKKLKIEMASNELNDITAVMGDTKKADFPNYFLPIDDLGFSKDNLLFYDTGLGEDGKLYKITSAVTYWAMVYNKKVFTDCGIASVPKTLDELYADCEKIKAKGIVPMTTNYKEAWPLTVISFMAAARKGDGNYLNTLVNGDLLTEDGIIECLKIYTTMRDKGYLDKDLLSASWDGTTQKDMASGKAAMTYLGSFAPKMFADQGSDLNNFGMFPFPGTKGATAASEWYFAVAKNSKNPDLAKAYLKFMWEDSRYAKATGMVSPIIGSKCEIPAVNELLTYGPPVESANTTEESSEITNKAQINLTSAYQEYLISKNPDDVIKKYNSKWAEARKALGK